VRKTPIPSEAGHSTFLNQAPDRTWTSCWELEISRRKRVLA
jgi:hypothetical protein